MYTDHGFDRADRESPFLTFVAREFRRRGTDRRKELASKQRADAVVSAAGIKPAKKYKVLTDIDELTWLDLKKRVVLKYARGWSARGVMLLERVRWNRYFDYMTLRTFSIDAIKQHQRNVAESFGGKDPSWILEEFLQPAQTQGAIPFDYKFYVFGQQIGAIGQFDRNSYPPRMALFDGAFNPLQEGKDYVLCSKNVQRGVPVVPPHAAQLQWWAMKLSSLTDAPFVSIDLYDTPSGPVFGEFTFSPGGTHKRMFKFSHEMLDHFDVLFSASDDHLAKNWEGNGSYPDTAQCRYLTELRSYDIRDVEELPKVSGDVYRVCSGVAYNQGSRGAARLSEQYSSLQASAANRLQTFVAKRFKNAWLKVQKQLEKRAQENKAPQ